MEIIPAIDLYKGRAVRLRRGDYEKVTDFGDPVEWLRRWQELGAEIVHIVDLEGARDGRLVQIELVRELAGAGIPIQVGGGIRTIDDLQALQQAGATRMILGTQAIETPELVGKSVDLFGDAIVIALDARDGKVATHGWVTTTQATAVDVAAHLAGTGVGRFLVTDIARDGMLTEPNYGLLTEVMDASRRAVIASGGVSNVDAVIRLREIGVDAAIVGRALYDGKLTLSQAMEAAQC